MAKYFKTGFFNTNYFIDGYWGEAIISIPGVVHLIVAGLGFRPIVVAGFRFCPTVVSSDQFNEKTIIKVEA